MCHGITEQRLVLYRQPVRKIPAIERTKKAAADSAPAAAVRQKGNVVSV
jgi:hypothetical protein